MPDVSTFTVDTRVLREIAASCDRRVEQVLRMAAFELEAEAKMVADAWPARDTGAMINSIGVMEHGGGDAEKNAGKASGLNPEAEITPLPRPEKGAFHVGPQVNYAYWVEYGSRGGKVPARPFLQPAFEFIQKVYSDVAVWRREFMK